MLGFRTSTMSCRQLFQREGNILVNISNHKIGSHCRLLDCNH